MRALLVSVSTATRSEGPWPSFDFTVEGGPYRNLQRAAKPAREEEKETEAPVEQNPSSKRPTGLWNVVYLIQRHCCIVLTFLGVAFRYFLLLRLAPLVSPSSIFLRFEFQLCIT